MTTLNPVFDSPVVIANYLYNLESELSPIKLQKSLYFLYAYYGGVYFNFDSEGESEGVNVPKTLFNARFEAWKYGPVIRDIYRLNKNDELGNEVDVLEAALTLSEYPEEKKFIDNLFNQINSVSDFSLVERSHQDDAWKDVYETESESKIMDNSQIIVEYQEKYI